ncbi:DNA topoisomerase III [Pseudobacillus wudalianchiensis]|uniref:DNA topoisomerase 3 n=1 Tax=Pseudobacillus wudalianchiensis TaxID=1743143 RepID=A0A1B9AG54_9BACI|nr:DNA topoisomerase III [Bacillus wudalianchiensis]OCA82820.1 DNA topoisomerase III [Bacillus wudalianchiensis]
MSKTVVLAEKPSVARDIARVLKCGKKGNGFLEGDQYIVTWALGHLVTHADPEAYGDQYKTWNLADLPLMPNQLKTVVIKKTGKQFQAVKAQLNRKDVKDIVIATDAGREGELVARWIIDKAHVKKPVKRLWISSVTDKAIREGFKKLRDGQEYENLYRSAVARAEADWLVGINATRALTTKFNAQLSCGRVQTPTLAMIAKREAEIKQFKPKSYYGITAIAGDMKLTWKDEKSNDTKTFSEEKRDQLLKAIRGEKAVITSVKKAAKKSYAPELYDLTELQRDAHKIFNYSAKETLSIMQKLYEQHKLVTYPRTDSRYLSSDMADTLKERVEAVEINPYAKFAAKVKKNGIKPNKSFINDAKVSDHHAIVPTEQTAILSDLSDKERKIYDLIVKRFLAVLLPPFEYEQTTVEAKIGSEMFTAKGKVIASLGWKEVYGKEEDDEASLPPVKQGEEWEVTTLTATQGETTPPARFNEGTLLSAMENPAKYMEEENKQLKQTLSQTGGLGTVATRADIIEKLFNTFLIEKKGKDIFITSKGKQLLELVPSELQSPALTGEWEQKLEAIAKGKLKSQDFMKEICHYTKAVTNEIKNSEKKFKHDNVTGSQCPDCGKLLLEVNGKKGKMLVCQDRECGYRKNVAKLTNARCPNCHKKLELRGEGKGQIFVCKCGYREKLTAFQERRKKQSGNKATKQDVNKYLKKQSKDEPMNTALADALAKLKLK